MATEVYADGEWTWDERLGSTAPGAPALPNDPDPNASGPQPHRYVVLRRKSPGTWPWAITIGMYGGDPSKAVAIEGWVWDSEAHRWDQAFPPTECYPGAITQPAFYADFSGALFFLRVANNTDAQATELHYSYG